MGLSGEITQLSLNNPCPGLAIRVKLLRSLPDRFKVGVLISPRSHASEAAINKQLADKERVAAALENSTLLEVVNQCLGTPPRAD